MEKLLPLLAHLLLVQGKLYISPERSNSPSETCIQTPRIKSTAEGYIVEVSESDLSFEKDQAFWIEYVRSYQAFLYRGCMDAVDMDLTYTEINLGLGNCLYHCEKAEFMGLSGRRCYCSSIIPKETNLKKHGCNKTCDNQPEALCGGQSRISVYEPVPFDEIPIPDVAVQGILCLSAERTANNEQNITYDWCKCDTSYRKLCSPDVEVDMASLYGSWEQKMQQCLSGDALPVKVPIDDSISATGQHWTGYIGINSITKGKGTIQGYVKYSDGKLLLHFDGITQSLRTLCDDGKHESESNNSQSNSKVAVYVAVPIVVIALAAVAVGIIWIIRKRQIKQKEANPNYVDPETQHKTKAKRTQSNPSYEASVRSNGKVTHDYFELEPDASYATVEDTTDSQEEDYDTTAQTQGNRKVNNTGNEYNTFKDFLEDPYSHTEKANKQADDTYNHCNAKGKKDDGAYDKVKVGNATTNADGDNNGQGNGAKEDSYSHIEKRDYR